jgi:hypothetical protein
LKRLSDSEVLTLSVQQQLRDVKPKHSFLRNAEQFFSHLFPSVVGYAPSTWLNVSVGDIGLRGNLVLARFEHVAEVSLVQIVM